MMEGLCARDISFQYGANSQPVLSGFSLDVPKGGVMLLTGASGCGKSTVCGVLSGMYPRHGGILSGSVVIGGEEIGDLSIARRAALVGMMFQNPDLQFCMDTVEAELVFCLENIRTPPCAIPARVDEALNFCGIDHLRRRKLHTLSGGEKQKTALACIVALRSRYILLDEPFANVDPESGASPHTDAKRARRC